MASEEGVDHQEAHFRPALLLRGIPADLDPASGGRAVLRPKAGASFSVVHIHDCLLYTSDAADE